MLGFAASASSKDLKINPQRKILGDKKNGYKDI